MSPAQVGVAQPVGLVEVRRGKLQRSHHHYPGLGYPTFGEYPGALSNGFWYPDWVPLTPWRTLDGIQSINIDQALDQNGISTCTVTMDNIRLVPTVGPASLLYHIVEKGYYSPLRGYVGFGRPDPGIAETPYAYFLPNAQVRVRQGYGPSTLVTTFLGLIDEVDTDSVPNQLTFTARDFGGVLVDQRFFGWAKEKSIRSPVTFANRAVTENSKLLGGGATASTTLKGYGADRVTARHFKEGWRSDLYDTAADTQWIEIRLPQGTYSNYYVKFPFDNMVCYVGIKPTATKSGPPSVDGYPIAADAWYDPFHNTVPGHYGGWPYFEEIPATTKGVGRWISLDGVFVVGDNTTLRMGFRNLGKVRGGYRAGMDTFLANRRGENSAAQKGQWITIDDVSDIVRCCLRWAGFKHWEVEETGVDLGLGGTYVADPSQTFMDVINVVKDMVGFTFFIGEPRNDADDQDLGYPIFRNNRVMENRTGPTEFIDDRLLLTDAKVKVSNQSDRCNIRCRGVAQSDGSTVDGDTVKRMMYSYIPHWAGDQAALQAGVLKPITFTNKLFTTPEDVQFGCYLIAIQIALAKYTAIIDLPANPGIGIDTLQSVIDRTQGLNSRIYVSNRSQTMQFGQNGYWTMELGGALVDTPEIDSIVVDYVNALLTLDRAPRAPWPRKRKK